MKNHGTDASELRDILDEAVMVLERTELIEKSQAKFHDGDNDGGKILTTGT